MIQSMTGYGKAKIDLTNKNFTIEIKSLNSKQIDTHIKMSSVYKDKEIALRNLISKKLQRGKIELSIWAEDVESSKKHTLNNELINSYFTQITKITTKLNINSKDIFASILKMPDVIQKGEVEAKENKNEWHEIQKGINAAIADLLKFRIDEGRQLEIDIQSRIHKLTELLDKITPFAKKRIKKVKENLHKKITLIDAKNIDENRFEQELIYYLEKQDITEEQIRLNAHLKYFKDTISASSPNGKKLGFIGQEIGREINTIGSKSSDVNMQKIVVQMKDELEKIKEQISNVL
tara:strand:+ start:49 stop:924 length:876 start_codon:yes stop_codon:yes gene_type:complete